jgi:hypothetical protein
MHVIYPCDPLNPKTCDEYYTAELAAMDAAGFNASVFSFEEFQAGSFRVFPVPPANSTILYRGWMLSSIEYGNFTSAVSQTGGHLLTDAQTYLLTHYLPNWYSLIPKLTPETRIFPADADLAVELRSLGWNKYFIKDYVKSLKTSTGSIISTPEQAATVISEMRQFRGTIEGGFCVRQVENFLPETEKRYFVLNSVPCSMSSEIPPIVKECARRIRSPFFSVDVIQREDGVLRIVEIGDGQVSDLVGWTPARFAEILAEHFGGKKLHEKF